MHIEFSGSGRDWYDFLTLGIGAVAALVAGGGGVIALRSYVATNSATAHNHMHHMFERFLGARDAHAASLKKPQWWRRERTRVTTSPREDSDFGGSVLYFLEEVYAWVCREERFLYGWSYRLLFPIDRRGWRRKLDITASWRATLVTQIISHREDVLKSLLGYSSCYSADFLAFAATTLSDPQLTERADLSLEMVRTRGPRPLGCEEKKQRCEVRWSVTRGRITRWELFLLGLGILFWRDAKSPRRS